MNRPHRCRAGLQAGLPFAVAAALALPPCASWASAQQIDNATIERRSLTGPIEREVQAIAAGRAPVWMAYNLQTIPSPRQMCPGSHVSLERTTALVVMARIERDGVGRVRSFTPECEVGAGGMTVLWIDGVSADASAVWLSSLVRGSDTSSERRQLVMEPALATLGLNAGAAATKSLISLARDDERSRVRGQALVWLAQRAGQEAVTAIGDAVTRDSETEVKRQAVYALSRLPPDQGVPLLIQVARTHANPEVRRRAIDYLGRSNDRRAVAFFAEVLLK